MSNNKVRCSTAAELCILLASFFEIEGKDMLQEQRNQARVVIKRFAVVAPLATLLLSSVAFAQQGIDEIVVTAKQRTESLFDVPLSITAYTTDMLRQAQILDQRDLADMTPGLIMGSVTGRGSITSMSMRGIAPNTSDERYQGVSIFLDGIALSGELMSLDLSTMERVEVLRGPQNATFGRATYSGAINYITQTPSGDSATGNFRLRGSKNDKAPEINYYAGASLTAPLVKDRVWGGVTVLDFRNGAQFTDIRDGVPIGLEKTTSITGMLYVNPSEDFSIKIRVTRDEDEDSQATAMLQHPREWVLAGVPTVRLPRAGNALWPQIIPNATFGVTTAQDRGFGEPFGGGRLKERLFGSMIAKYNVHGYEISYSYGYFQSTDRRTSPTRSRSVVLGEDPVFGRLIGTQVTTLLPAQTLTREYFQNNSHQLLLVSPGTDRFRWRLGGYYFYERDDNFLLLAATPSNTEGRWRRENQEDYAGFGGVDYDVTPELTVSGEARVAHESTGFLKCPGCVNNSTTDVFLKDTSFSPRVTVDYEFDEESHVYALYSRGDKSGRISFATPPGAPAPAYVKASPEKLDNFEIGSKNYFWDRRVSLNVAAYHAKVADQQLITSQLFSINGVEFPVSAVFNVGSSRINGFEVEATIRPIEPLLLTGGFSVADQVFTGKRPLVVSASTSVYFPGTSPSDPIVLDGKHQANVPRMNGFMAAEYTIFQALGEYDVKFRADFSYRGKMYGDLANISRTRPGKKVNARASLANENSELALYVRNLTNNKAPTSVGPAGQSSACIFRETNTAQYGTNQQCLFPTLPRLRELGVELFYKF